MTHDSRLETIRAHLRQSAAVLRATADTCAEDIARGVDLIVASYRSGGKVLLCGNGGSAADCQHLAAELVNVLSRTQPRRALAAIALTTDTSVLTAIANDFGFDQIFARQVEALGKAGDVLLAISTSGESPNVVRALHQARSQQMATLLMTGSAGSTAMKLSDLTVSVPSHATHHIQEGHAGIGHLLCELIGDAMATGEPS